jgi:hypothetical protein
MKRLFHTSINFDRSNPLHLIIYITILIIFAIGHIFIIKDIIFPPIWNINEFLYPNLRYILIFLLCLFFIFTPFPVCSSAEEYIINKSRKVNFKLGTTIFLMEFLIGIYYVSLIISEIQ